MSSTWWKNKDELDEDQKEFILLPAGGKHLLIGPPGSGKTNLLLLRAKYIAGSGDENILIITYTNYLAEFIRSGISKSGVLQPGQVMTFHSWISQHIISQLGPEALPSSSSEGFNDDTRTALLKKGLEANSMLSSMNIYSAIFVDEAQDFTKEELQVLLSLSERVCICGDIKQGIYHKDGLDIGNVVQLTEHRLSRHYRIGPKIARVADRLMPPAGPAESLEAVCNYNDGVQGESSAEIYKCANREEQFALMLEKLRVQLVGFKDEKIGILCGRNETKLELKELFDQSELASRVHVQGASNAALGSDAPIQILSIHAAKGTEFKAVHIFGAEDLAKFPLNRTRLHYTAVTRAKTALNAYYTDVTSPRFSNAFATPSLKKLDDIFDL